MMGASVCDLFPVPFLPASTGWLQGEGRAETGIEKLNLSWEPGRGCSSGRLVWKEAALVAAPELVSSLGNEVSLRWRSSWLEFPHSAALLGGTRRDPPEPEARPGEMPETQNRPHYLNSFLYLRVKIKIYVYFT